ncbi:hypothetical protein N658DRAFT_569480 [Parathielavia hyrcaniae]|uniref:Gag-like protein n=1 Tax=Parathielavia hyrcaniae TaxID=113614 RepID=A0AAN6PSL2_9PEZI|nr:hypothetical protein N658DRAFT_569480 [Parathielavia hyrcaniae]
MAQCAVCNTRDALNSPEPRRRPLRSPKPSVKVRETLISVENKAKAAKNTTPPNSSPANLNSTSSVETTPLTMTDSLFCTIDTSRVESGGGDKTSVGASRTIVEREIRGMEDRVNWRCRAVTKDPKNPNRVRIACRDEAELSMVKQVTERKMAPGTRVPRNELYPIKVDNVNRSVVLDDEGNIRTGAAEAFSQENETTVAKIACLSRKDTAKAYGSMVVYVTKGSDARRLLNEGFFHAGGESGYTRVFERREIGHKAFSCKKAQVCARCAKQGHHHSGCKETIMKCVLCGGPHESFSQNCQKLNPTSQK